MYRLTRQELHWRTDIMDAKAGNLGQWWMERVQRFHADGGVDWAQWRTIRMTEWPGNPELAPTAVLDGSPQSSPADDPNHTTELLAG